MTARRRLLLGAAIGAAVALAAQWLPAAPPPALDANGNALVAHHAGGRHVE